MSFKYPIFTNENEVKLIREKIINNAIKLKGTKFSHRGRTRYGIDCLGLDWISYRRSGINLPDGDGRIYEINWFLFCKEERYLKEILKYFEWTTEHKQGDIPLFRCFNKKITHCGLWLKDNSTEFIHAFSGSCVKIDSINQKWFRNRYAGTVKYKGFKGEI